jgi:hypothetical protein
VPRSDACYLRLRAQLAREPRNDDRTVATSGRAPRARSSTDRSIWRAAVALVAIPSAAMAHNALPGERPHDVKLVLENVQALVNPDIREDHRLADARSDFPIPSDGNIRSQVSGWSHPSGEAA